MQLDSTRIAIRERNLLDTFDLALHVLRKYFKPLLITFFVGAIPLMVINDLLVGWIMSVEYRDTYFFSEEAGAIWRFWWDMTCLVFIEAPLASIFMTSFLGQAVFVARPSYREVFRDVRKMWARVFWCQLLVRAILPACLVLLLVERHESFNPTVELLLLGGIAAYAALVRSIRPYINEIVLLERNPLTSRNPSAITIGKRSKDLHGPSGGDLFVRWLATALLGALLTACVFGAFVFCSGTFLNDWQPGPMMIRYFYPFAMWVVAGYLSVVHFLCYLDLRIRHEGWEVELRLRGIGQTGGEADMSKLARQFVRSEEQSCVPLALPVPTALRCPTKSALAEPVEHWCSGLALILCFAALLLLVDLPAYAQEVSDTQSVEAAREALDGPVTFPWYDSQSDGLRRLKVEPPDDFKNRRSTWERKIKPKKTRTPWQMPDWMWTTLEVLGWTLLVMALAALGYFLIRAFLISESGYASGVAVAEGKLGAGDIDRVESLPFQLAAPQADLLSEARRHYEAGNYKDAIVYLYSYQLVELDKHQLIRLTKGKTNRQYLREVRRRGDLFGSLRATMLAFEDVFFGNHSLDRGRFESCWSGLDAFHQSLEQATA